MDEHRDPQTSAPDEGELLAAYLDAETDDITSARVERLLREDPHAAARLDALARTRARLQRLDEVAPSEGFRERLTARMEAERAQSTWTPARGDEPQTLPAARRAQQRWFAPLTAAAALILVAVIGGAALLGQAGSGEDSAAAPAELQAESSRAADAPMAGADEGAEAAEEGAPAAGSGEPSDSLESLAIPRISGDARLAEHLRRLAQASEDPFTREFEQRQRAGLSTAPMCIGGIDERAADLVEFNERLVVAALIDGDDGPRVVLYDARSCRRLRTFATE